MTITYVQASNPIWYFSDLTGKPAGGGQVWFYNSLNPDVLKYVYQDPAGLIPWRDPVDINLNGTAGPFYFQVDSTGVLGNYDIFAYDAQGNLIEQINNFTPPGGGGGSVTENLILNNIVPNNVMYRNSGVTAISPGANTTILAPGAHQGLSITPTSNYGPDICFFKNNASAVDTISFPRFALGFLPFGTSDVTPVDYLNYICTSSGTAESLKFVNFPMIQNVQNLANQSVAGTIWGICTSGNTALSVNIAQFFGDGSAASATVITTLSNITLTNAWTEYTFTGSIPDVSGMTRGQCGNDGVFFQVGLPLNAATNIGFTKPCLYLGDVAPLQNYINYDEISGIVEAPRTGDYRISLNGFGFAPNYGWVPMNDGVIGNAGSTPPSPIVTTRLNLDTFPLFNLIWTTFSGSSGAQLLAPMYARTGGSAIAYGSTAIADWTAGNVISLTGQAGRLIAGIGKPSSGNNTGSTWGIGTLTGSEQTNQVASHTHAVTDTLSGSVTVTGLTSPTPSTGSNVGFIGNSGLSASATFGVNFAGSIVIQPTGIAEVNIQNPVVYQNIFMKL